jgi:hypothetical protein
LTYNLAEEEEKIGTAVSRDLLMVKMDFTDHY